MENQSIPQDSLPTIFGEGLTLQTKEITAHYP